jgi:hypothetical protein
MKRRLRHGLITCLAFVCIISQGILCYKVIWGGNLIDDIQYKEETLASSIGRNETRAQKKIIICGVNTSIPNRVFFPVRFMKQPQFKALRNDLKSNTALLKDNYIIFGNRSSSFSVYYHIHKAGGTTMQHLQTPVEKEDLNWETERRIGKEAFDQTAVELLDDVRRQSAFLFSFCRDPVLRFFSALGQLLSMPQRHFKLSPCHRHKTSSQKLIQCVLDKIMNNGNSKNYLDPHFMPQVYELYSAVHQQEDIGIQLFSLSSFDDFQRSCGVNGNSNLPARYRVGKSLPGFPSLSIDEALTPELLRQICELYRMDVIFLEALNGLVSTLCMANL